MTALFLWALVLSLWAFLEGNLLAQRVLKEAGSSTSLVFVTMLSFLFLKIKPDSVLKIK